MRHISSILILLLLCPLASPKDDPSPPDAKAMAKVKAELAKHVALLKADDAGRRFASAVELGKLRHPAAVGPLLEVLAGDKDLFVRRACARALGEIRRREAVPGLIDALADAEIFVALQASKALCTITGVSHGFSAARSAEDRLDVQKLWRAWWASLSPKERVGETPKKAVGETPTRPKPAADLTTLVKKLSSDDAGDRFCAAVELGKLGDARAVGSLLEGLAADHDHFVRRACGRALGEIGRREAVPALIDALTDREIFVALAAAKALRKITGVAPDLSVRKEDGGQVGGYPSLEQRREIQARYRAWWKDVGSKRTNRKDGEEEDGESKWDVRMPGLEPVPLRLPESPPPDHVARFLSDARMRTDRFLSPREGERIPAFAASNGTLVWDALCRIRDENLAAGSRLCEWGSGIGLVTGLAALAGFEARGIEIEPVLVTHSRDLLESHGIEARIDEGSYLPSGAFTDEMDAETFAPADADVVYAYPWPAEEAVLARVFMRHAPVGSMLLTFHGGVDLRLRRKTNLDRSR